MTRRIAAKHLSLISCLCFALLFSLPSFAGEQCPVPYSEFEEAIPHIDMPACPDNLPNKDKGFCRLVMQGAEAFVYSFHYTDEDPCLVSIQKAKKSTYLRRE